MCRPVKCKVCNKTTWAGCGQHIASVKARVPTNDWCDGKHDGQAPKGFLAKLFGR